MNTKIVKIQVAIFTMVCIFLSCSTCFSGGRALLVGIEDYVALPASSRYGAVDLKGSVNDVRAIKKALISYYGFVEGDIRVLINDEATRQNIETVMKEWLIKDTNSGDVVIFYFSGYGSRVQDYNGDEKDGLDEVLCPYDTRPKGGKNIILDDELGVWLSKLSGRTVVAIIDSCHSGGAVRSIQGKTVSALEDTPARRARFIPVTNYPSPSIPTAKPQGTDIPEGVVFMAASQEHETAFEVRMPDGFHGGFTFGLCDAMTHLHLAAYEEIFDYARKVVKDRLQLPQDPLIIAKKEITPRAVFGTVRSASPPAVIDRPMPPPEIVGTSVLVALETLEKSSRKEMEKLREQLALLPMIDLVEKDDFFDRLVRGEKKNGRYHVRLLNRVGDGERMKPAASIEELIDLLGSRLEYAYTVKQLSFINHPNPPFKVKVWVADHSRRNFRIGEKIIFGIEAEKDCYVFLINVDTEGNSNIIFPNPYHQNNFIRAHKPTLIPDEKMKAQGFELLLTPPAGEETIKVIATTEPLKLEALGLEGSQETFRTLTRSKSVIFSNKVISTLCSKKFDWSEDTIVIRIYDETKI